MLILFTKVMTKNFYKSKAEEIDAINDGEHDPEMSMRNSAALRKDMIRNLLEICKKRYGLVISHDHRVNEQAETDSSPS